MAPHPALPTCPTRCRRPAGIGVCAALALLELPPTEVLPPLECLFTIDEETGLTGGRGRDGGSSRLVVAASRLLGEIL